MRIPEPHKLGLPDEQIGAYYLGAREGSASAQQTIQDLRQKNKGLNHNFQTIIQELATAKDEIHDLRCLLYVSAR